MRVKIGNCIRFYIKAAYNKDSDFLLLIDTTNIIDRIVFANPYKAKNAYEQLLRDGYCDCSDCDYSCCES